MKKILIISDGDAGEHFIRRVIETYTSENIYYVVEMRAKEYEDANPARFKFFEFDPTSLYKLSNLLKMDFSQVFITMESAADVQNTIKNIRVVSKQLRIIVLNQWSMKNQDPNVVFINAHEILASMLIDYLPNVPVIAQNVGLGEGEIMEVLVPFGSSFVYRHLGVIEQKNWRIVAIYRNRKLIMPSRRRMIQPNDLLLLVGEPAVLKSVYRAIKRELGQFPEPFGSNLYVYIDMNIMKHDDIKEFVRRAVFVHKKFKHDLIIKVLNPGDVDILSFIKEYRSDNVIVSIEYNKVDADLSFHNDIKLYHVGLVIISKETFNHPKTKNTLYEAHVPILKISNRSFSSVQDAAIILAENRDLEKISTNIFDIAEQMGFNIELYNYLSEMQEEKEQVIEHYNNLSTIFSKSIKVINDNQNPIRTLKQKDNFIQILPFTKKLTKRKFYSLFATDSESLYHKLDDHHQIFIPVQI
jgi:hypothetical protein